MDKAKETMSVNIHHVPLDKVRATVHDERHAWVNTDRATIHFESVEEMLDFSKALRDAAWHAAVTFWDEQAEQAEQADNEATRVLRLAAERDAAAQWDAYINER